MTASWDLASRIWGMPRSALDTVAASLVGLNRAGFGGGRSPAPAPSRARGGVTVIPVHGPLLYRPSAWSAFFGAPTVLELQQQFRAALRDASVTGLVFDVDSAGGTIDGVAEFAAEIQAARARKPIVAVANTQALSAAYWLASAADVVLATRTAHVGGLGIYTLHEDLHRFYDRLGRTVSVVASHRRKGEALPYAALSEDARAHLQGQVEAAYDLFVNGVAAGRRVPAAVVRSERFGGGRAYPASEALTRGLVDAIGTLDQAIARAAGNAARVAGSSGDPLDLEARWRRVYRGTLRP